VQGNQNQYTPTAEPAPPKQSKRAIEESFPIVEINRLAIPERNAFKAIYQMHKWFARRASCVFRAILLGTLKPAGTDIMEEFYQDHTHDPDTKGKVVLDPFMGGGTTIVEALRLGCKVIGIDLSPVAWFIVKTEVEPVDLDELKSAFERLANRKTVSGLTVREELLSHYKTRCPACGNEDADTIYVFWVKSAICTNPECKKQVPLFSDYLVAQRSPSIRFFSDARCPDASCGKTFDWEIEPAAMVGEGRLMLVSALDGAGEGRGNRRWTYAASDASAQCPWCEKRITPKTCSANPQRKKVRISVFYCPRCACVFQFRGTPPHEINCPGCLNSFSWENGNVPNKGKFHCPHCGQGDAIIESIRRLPGYQLLPTRMFALEGYCSPCAWNGKADEVDSQQQSFLEEESAKTDCTEFKTLGRTSLLWKNKGKFFKALEPADERSYQEACCQWENEKNRLPYPEQAIPPGYNTNQMIKHNFRYWHQMFNGRQLLCLATLLNSIRDEEDQTLKEMLLSAFFSTLEGSNMFARFKTDQQRSETPKGVFARHDFQPKLTPCEDNVWGLPIGKGFSRWMNIVLKGKSWAKNPEDSSYRSTGALRGVLVRKRRAEVAEAKVVLRQPSLPDLVDGATLVCGSASPTIRPMQLKMDAVVTDPPYAGNVNYSELADFFYVWLRLALAQTYRHFAPELGPKSEEIIVNPNRGKSMEDFRAQLKEAFSECYEVCGPESLLVFTFHHSEESAWEALLDAMFEAGWVVNCVYPVQAEAESSMNLQAGSNISYDLIHVCRKRPSAATIETRSWATIKADIRREARREIQRIESGVYGSNRSLAPADKLIVLVGKCLQLYSRHYNAVVDHARRVIPLKEALEDIRMLVDQLVSQERPLPRELEDIDRPSYVYLTALSEKNEIKSDEVHKATRGIIEPEELLEAGLMKRGRAGRGRTFEVKTPSERFSALLEKFKEAAPVPQSLLFDNGTSPSGNGTSLFIDRLHFLIALAEGKENLRPWIERWGGEIPQIRAACEYLLERRKDFAPALKKILTMIDVGSLGFK